MKLARSSAHYPNILDVGGRKSHYTIGVPGDITITDLPRETEIQKMLRLGVNDQIIGKIMDRRSNVSAVIFDDMTRSSMRDTTFDFVVSIEVLEHVDEDELFVKEVHRVLKPGGTFIMTTPNGDYVKNTNPDHKRHYTREQLRSLLREYFDDVEVDYAIRGGRFRTMGLRGWSVRRPLRTVSSMVGNFVNTIQSAPESIKSQPKGTRHLIAVARRGQ